ncbi:MAG: hypothetical protein M1829_002310 [Trizodia sp. TS-e1964]|nr:MAG: hypothetical protein M1829_002310 [Trizodia sp. TS-e1964]
MSATWILLFAVSTVCSLAIPPSRVGSIEKRTGSSNTGDQFYPNYLVPTTIEQALESIGQARPLGNYQIGSMTIIAPTDTEVLRGLLPQMRRIITITACHSDGTPIPWPSPPNETERFLVISLEIDPRDGNWKPYLGWMGERSEFMGDDIMVKKDFEELGQTQDPFRAKDIILGTPVQNVEFNREATITMRWVVGVTANLKDLNLIF